MAELTREAALEIARTCKAAFYADGSPKSGFWIYHAIQAAYRLGALSQDSGCKCICHSHPEHVRLQDAIEALDYYHKENAELRKAAQSQLAAAGVIQGTCALRVWDFLKNFGELEPYIWRTYKVLFEKLHAELRAIPLPPDTLDLEAFGREWSRQDQDPRSEAPPATVATVLAALHGEDAHGR